MSSVHSADKRFRIGLRSGLTICFGGLVFLAVVVVLALGLGSAQKNTTDLQAAQAQVAMALVREGLESRLLPLEAKARHVGNVARDMNPAERLQKDGPLVRMMTGTLSPDSSAYAIGFFAPDGRWTVVQKDPQLPSGLQVFEGIDGDRMEGSHGEAFSVRGGEWGPVIMHPFKNVPIINYRFPVVVDGALVGGVVAVARVDELSKTIADIAAEVDGGAFVLYGEQNVLAHPLFVGTRFPKRKLPLPLASEVPDPLVTLFASGERIPLQGRIEGLDASFVSTPDDGYLTLSQKLLGFGELPWTVVLHYPLEDISAEFKRMIAAAVAGLVVLVISIAIAVIAARRIARPLTHLADFAEDISNLNLHGLKPLPRSRLREVDEAATSMNAMRNGLTWFEAYVPKRLVTRLMASEGSAALGGEQRQITVMFTDIIGFTSMAEHLSAEQTAEFLNDHFRLLADVIEESGGTIDKFIGDCVMAFWGAPEDQSDHAQRAVEAALAIRKVIDTDNQARTARGEPAVGLRVGIHTGPVVVGNIGAPRRMNYTIVGDTVNTANRLEQAARDQVGQLAVTILISDDTCKAADCAQAARPAGDIHLRGRDAITKAWLL